MTSEHRVSLGGVSGVLRCLAVVFVASVYQEYLERPTFCRPGCDGLAASLFSKAHNIIARRGEHVPLPNSPDAERDENQNSEVIRGFEHGSVEPPERIQQDGQPEVEPSREQAATVQDSAGEESNGIYEDKGTDMREEGHLTDPSFHQKETVDPPTVQAFSRFDSEEDGYSLQFDNGEPLLPHTPFDSSEDLTNIDDEEEPLVDVMYTDDSSSFEAADYEYSHDGLQERSNFAGTIEPERKEVLRDQPVVFNSDSKAFDEIHTHDASSVENAHSEFYEDLKDDFVNIHPDMVDRTPIVSNTDSATLDTVQTERELPSEDAEFYDFQEDSDDDPDRKNKLAGTVDQEFETVFDQPSFFNTTYLKMTVSAAQFTTMQFFLLMYLLV